MHRRCSDVIVFAIVVTFCASVGHAQTTNKPKNSQSDGPVIQQTLVAKPNPYKHPDSSSGFDYCAAYGYGPECPKKVPDSISIECKILSVGADKPQLVTVTLTSESNYAPEAYPNGICRSGGFARHTMIRVASGNPNYRWMGAWCQPWMNPMGTWRVQVWENGQVRSCMTSRIWNDLKPGRQAASHRAIVEMDESGNVVSIQEPNY
jgi:hypothetical protein